MEPEKSGRDHKSLEMPQKSERGKRSPDEVKKIWTRLNKSRPARDDAREAWTRPEKFR